MGYDIWDPNDQVTSVENDLLIQHFLENEIHQAIFESDPNGAPGPDGLTFKFYRFFWDTVKFDLIILCNQFHAGHLELQFLNKSIICLIPKELDAQVIKKFRLISLVNVVLKCSQKS